VYSKASSTLADVVFYGYVTLDISAATGGDTAAGVYYLSGTTPGLLTRQRPPVSVAVLRADGNGRVLVVPQLVDLMERHVHYAFDLACLPAGATTPPVPGDRHTIDVPDPDAPGWLPAFHASFGGVAPAGAVFGYNLAAHPALRDVWPPVPASQATLEWDRGLDKEVGATGVPLGRGGLCVLDRNGIWWMSDCYGDVPWPTTLDTATPASDSLSHSASEVECPRTLSMALRLWFTRVNFATDATAVTSLRSLSDRLVVRCVDGSEAATGDLTIDLDLDLVTREGVAGYQALKGLDGNTFSRGPVCEGVYALSDNVTLSSPAASIVDGEAVHHGPVGIAVSTDPSKELPVQLFRLDGAEEEFYLDTMYISLPEARETGVRCRIEVPADAALPSPQLRLRLTVLGRVLGTLPTLTVTARRLPRPASGLDAPEQLPDEDAEFAVAVDTAATLSLGGQYVEAAADPFEVAAGDTVFVSVTRADDDGYPGAVGLIRVSGLLVSG
jgi:hypothetical protein